MTERGQYRRDELAGRRVYHVLKRNEYPTSLCARELLEDERHRGKRFGVETAILRTSKQVYREALDILYQNQFCVDVDYAQAVLAQDPKVVAKFWKKYRKGYAYPITVPPTWNLSLITNLHLRLDPFLQASRPSLSIGHQRYPVLTTMESLRTLEICVIYTLWDTRWANVRLFERHQYAVATQCFRDPSGNSPVPSSFTVFIKKLLKSIPRTVNTVRWVGESTEFRPRTTAPEFPWRPVEDKPERAYDCVGVEVLQRVAGDVQSARAASVGWYQQRIEGVQRPEEGKIWKWVRGWFGV